MTPVGAPLRLRGTAPLKFVRVMVTVALPVAPWTIVSAAGVSDSVYSAAGPVPSLPQPTASANPADRTRPWRIQRFRTESRMIPRESESVGRAREKQKPASWVSPPSRFRDSLPSRHWRAVRRRASGITASELPFNVQLGRRRARSYGIAAHLDSGVHVQRDVATPSPRVLRGPWLQRRPQVIVLRVQVSILHCASPQEMPS